MKINNNIQALNAYRNLNKNQFQTSKNLEKLSSGLRINRAADDAAGLAISEKMRSQIRGLKMAERNAMDGISLLQTAEGAMQEVHAMLQRMRELAVQGANDTNTDQDRAEIQKEIRQLVTEIDSVAEKTEFNTRKLLNGSSAVLSVVDTNQANVVGLPTIMDPSVKTGRYELNIADQDLVYKITQPAAGLKGATDIQFADPSIKGQQLGEYTINIRNYNSDSMNPSNTGATIQVIGPDGLPIAERAVTVGSAGEIENIGGLEIDASKITGAGTVKISIEATATFTVSSSTDLQPNDLTVKKDSTVAEIKALSSREGSFVEGAERIDVIEKVNPIAGNTVASADTSGNYFTAVGKNGQEVTFRVVVDGTIAPSGSTVDLTTNPNIPTVRVVDANQSIQSVLDTINAATYETGRSFSNATAYVRNDTATDTVTEEMKIIATKEDETFNSYDVDFYNPVAFNKVLTTVNGRLEHGGVEFNFNSNINNGTSEFSIINNALAFQIGPNTNQNVMIDVDELNTVRLNIDEVRVTTQAEANTAIFALDRAIQQVSSIRAKLGATQNRMEHTINNLQVTHENLTASESRIRDADMALEMTEFTRNNILNQSATAMLAQANQLPQGVLQLLQ